MACVDGNGAPVSGGATIGDPDLEETSITVNQPGIKVTTTANFSNSVVLAPLLAKFSASHREFVKKQTDNTDTWYSQHSKDAYSVTVKLDLSNTGIDLSKINADTEIEFTLGDFYDMAASGFYTLGNAQKKKFDGLKGGFAVFGLYDENDAGKTVLTEKISFKWSKKKILYILITGKPLLDSEYNVLDLSEMQGELMNSTLKGMQVRFGDIIWEGDSYTISFKARKKNKSIIAPDGEGFDLLIWSASGTRKQ